MDVLVAGPSGPMLRWICALVAAAVAVVHPTLENVGVGDVWMPRTTPAPEAPARILVTHRVSESYATAVQAGELRAVIVLDNPDNCFHQARTDGHDTISALRHLIACITSLGELATCPGALTLIDDVRRDPGQVLHAVVEHLGLALDDSALADLSTRFGIAGTDTTLVEAMLTLPELTAEDDALVQATLVPAVGYAATGTRMKMIWPRAILFWGDRQPDFVPPPRIIDITGRARNLVYGPSFCLPSGRWRMGMRLAFSPSARGTLMAIGLFGPDHLGGGRFIVEHAGVFDLSTMVTVPSSRAELEIRLSLERGAIEGKFGFDGLTFTPESE